MLRLTKIRSEPHLQIENTIMKIVTKLKNISFKDTVIWVFLVGNIALSFVSSLCKELILLFDRSLNIHSYIRLYPTILYLIFSLIFVYIKSLSLNSIGQIKVNIFIGLFLILCFFSFFLTGFLSPLSFIGGYGFYTLRKFFIILS